MSLIPASPIMLMTSYRLYIYIYINLKYAAERGKKIYPVLVYEFTLGTCQVQGIE